MIHILAVEASLVYNIDSQKHEYTQRLEVTQDIIDWLDAHDIEYSATTEKVYICNNIRYVYMGPKLIVVEMPLGKGGEA